MLRKNLLAKTLKVTRVIHKTSEKHCSSQHLHRLLDGLPGDDTGSLDTDTGPGRNDIEPFKAVTLECS
jgi:hypothetical protein